MEQGRQYDASDNALQMPALRAQMDEENSRAPGAVSELQTNPLGQSGAGYVYFIETKNQQFIKIGFSIRPVVRFSQLGTLRPGNYAIQLIGWMPGTYETEHWLHAKFIKDRDNGEWFRDSPALRQFIAEIGLNKSDPAPARSRKARHTFTRRQREVLHLFFNGKDTTEVSKILEISTANTNCHISTMCDRAQVKRSELIVWILQHPDCLSKGYTVVPGLHVQPCSCGSPYCAVASAQM